MGKINVVIDVLETTLIFWMIRSYAYPYVLKKLKLTHVAVEDFQLEARKQLVHRPLLRFDDGEDFYEEKPPKHYFKMLSFTSKNASCRRYCLKRKRPCITDFCSFSKLREMLSVIDSAQRSLELCIYLITCNDLAKAIIRAQERGVLVRIIVDEEMSTATQSKVPWFVNADISVKASQHTSFLMHHKFCIIDQGTKNQRVIFGSLNWTLQGLAGNYEVVVIFDYNPAVQEFVLEFNTLWNDFTINKKKKVE